MTKLHLLEFLSRNNITRRTIRSIINDYPFLTKAMLPFYEQLEAYEDCTFLSDIDRLGELDDCYLFFIPPHGAVDLPTVLSIESHTTYDADDLVDFFEKTGVYNCHGLVMQELADLPRAGLMPN